MLLDTYVQKNEQTKMQEEIGMMNDRSWKTKHAGMILVIAAITLAGSIGHAQFPGMGGKKKAGAEGGGDVNAYSKSVSDAVGNGLKSRLLYLDSQANLAESLGLKTDAYVKASEAARAGEGATSDKQINAIKNSVVSPDALKERDAALAESKEFSAEAKKKFAEGGGKCIMGLIAETELLKQVTGLVQQGNAMAQSAGPMEKVKVLGLVKPVADLASILPGDVKELTATVSAIITIAKKQNIEIPGADTLKAKLGDL